MTFYLTHHLKLLLGYLNEVTHLDPEHTIATTYEVRKIIEENNKPTNIFWNKKSLRGSGVYDIEPLSPDKGNFDSDDDDLGNHSNRGKQKVSPNVKNQAKKMRE